MKRTGICTKCACTRVMKVDWLADLGGEGEGERYGGRLLVRASGGRDAYGRLEAYVCTGCGWFEEYVADVSKIPWDRVNAAPHAPTGGSHR